MATKPSSDSWSRVAHLYAKAVNETDPESPTSRSTQQINAIIAETLPLSKASFILDIGCGNGQVIASVLNSPAAASIPADARIVAADHSKTFIDMLTERKRKAIEEGKKIWERLEIYLWNAQELDEIEDGEVSHLLGGFAFFAMQDEKRALAEALRILKPGGLFVETSLGHTDWGHLPSFIAEVHPHKTIPGPGKQWFTASSTTTYLSDVGFRNVDAREFDVCLPMASRQEGVDFVVEVFPMVKPLMADMSEEEVRRTKGLMLGYLEERYPGVEGGVKLRGRAVVGWGTK